MKDAPSLDGSQTLEEPSDVISEDDQAASDVDRVADSKSDDDAQISTLLTARSDHPPDKLM